MINEWKQSIIEQLVTSHIYNEEHEDDPYKAINDLISFHINLALDPLVSKNAGYLIEKGYQLALNGNTLPFEPIQEPEGDF